MAFHLKQKAVVTVVQLLKTPLLNTSSSSTSCGAAPVRDTAPPSTPCWRLCCLIWFREGRDWLAAATVSFVQSSTSLWRSSVNVPLLLLLLLVCTRASCGIGCGDGKGVAAVGCVWLVAVWAPVVLREDPIKHKCVKNTYLCVYKSAINKIRPFNQLASVKGIVQKKKKKKSPYPLLTHKLEG